MPEHAGLGRETELDVLARQGQPPFTVEMKITDDAGRELPWDGRTFGRLKVRGPCVTRAYFAEDKEAIDAEGFFDTGDVATMDALGSMQVTDRSKDVIKSGGEWISSIELENLAVSHPQVAEAAVIAVPHPKWGERPLLVVVLKAGESPSRDDILAFMRGKVANWWLPDDVVAIEEIPHTATGKIQKTTLRDRFRDYVLPSATAMAG
jgi:fatty-acyl-CoA synthase